MIAQLKSCAFVGGVFFLVLVIIIGSIWFALDTSSTDSNYDPVAVTEEAPDSLGEDAALMLTTPP